METKKLCLILAFFLFSINLVLANSCTDTDSTSKYKNGINYYQKGVISGENNKGSWNMEDYCKDKNNLYEFYCYYSKGQYYNGTAIYRCSGGCSEGVCIRGNSIIGKTIDSSITSTSTQIYLGVIAAIILIIIYFLFLNKKRKNRISKKGRGR